MTSIRLRLACRRLLLGEDASLGGLTALCAGRLLLRVGRSPDRQVFGERTNSREGGAGVVDGVLFDVGCSPVGAITIGREVDADVAESNAHSREDRVEFRFEAREGVVYARAFRREFIADLLQVGVLGEGAVGDVERLLAGDDDYLPGGGSGPSFTKPSVGPDIFSLFDY